MKSFFIFVVTLFLSLITYAQSAFENDTSISSSSQQIAISFSPAGFAKNFFASTQKFTNGQFGIAFFTTIQRQSKMPEVAITNIILTSSNNSLITLDKPYRDTIYFNIDGSLSLNIIHLLNKDQVPVLRENNITAITLNVDGQPMRLEITRKSQRRLKDLIIKTFN
ncbi:MAG: hypothetical protein QM726_11130 [Chitinophagaceae bacterium]